MIVYRIGRTRWAKVLNGEGARLNGGRWNEVGTACLYTSESRALAILEYTVNTNIEDVPRHLSITTIEVPDNILSFAVEKLPGNWKDSPAPASAKQFGSKLIKANTHPVLRFPSAIVNQEFNYILNPSHPQSVKFKIVEVVDFIYDIRIKSR